MAIEGPLRELGIHDVFQLLDLSRKTGVLRVTSELRDDEGNVSFDNGKVVAATIRSQPQTVEQSMLQSGRVTETDVEEARNRQAGRSGASISDLLIEIGATTSKEVERYLRQHVESVIFELMSWSEGYFSFEERPRDALPSGGRIAVSTESLLMEGARRIDEWSRIADTIPHVGVIPELAPMPAEREGSQLDLLPHEWQVLAMIDGASDLRDIARALVRDEFEIAKVAYGLVSTGVVQVRVPRLRTSAAYRRRSSTETDALMASARAHARAGRHAAAVEDLRRAARADTIAPEIHRALGFAAARVGDFALARRSWEEYLRLAEGESDVQPVRDALELMTSLTSLVEVHGLR
jgi:hypothetical protein